MTYTLPILSVNQQRSKFTSVFTENEVINYVLLETINIFSFFLLLLLYFSGVKKFKVILKGKSAVSRLVRMCLAQPGYGSKLLPPVYNRRQKISYFSSAVT